MTPPLVIIFYSTENRSFDAPELNAETKSNCVKDFFQGRNYPCKICKDPTEEDIFSTITEATSGSGTLSALIVFVMTHGSKGLMCVKGGKVVEVRSLISHMYLQASGLPKVYYCSKHTYCRYLF